MLDIRLQLVRSPKIIFTSRRSPVSRTRRIRMDTLSGLCFVYRVFYYNRSMSPSYFTLANDRITLCTLSYEIRRHLARRLRSGYKNFVESIQSRLWRTIRILFEGRRNESVDRECDERVRRALRNRGERGRWWLEKEEPSARRDRFA